MLNALETNDVPLTAGDVGLPGGRSVTVNLYNPASVTLRDTAVHAQIVTPADAQAACTLAVSVLEKLEGQV